MTTRSELIDLTSPVRVLSALSTLGDLALRPALGVTRHCTLADAGGVMERAEVSALLVEGVGVVTERDIARAVAHGLAGDEPVGEVATWHPVTVDPSMPIVDAAATMLNEHVRHLLVDLPAGRAVVSLRDVTGVLLQVANPEMWLASLRVAIHAPAETWLG